MKKNTDYTIHILIALFLFACFASSCNYGKQGGGEIEIGKTYKYDSSAYYSYGGGGISYPLIPYKEIINLTTDERGLISFTFKDGNDTMGLDYLTVEGFNHWLRGEIDSVYNDADYIKKYKGRYSSIYRKLALDEGKVIQEFEDGSFNIVGELVK